jgi:hypothetical protein
MNAEKFRENLVELLRGGQAHVSATDAIADLSAADARRRPAGFDHCAWEVLEHMRLAQEDILRYTLNGVRRPGRKVTGPQIRTRSRMSIGNSAARSFAPISMP